MKYIYMILDLQFGSTGKGLLAGYLAKERQPDTIVTAWGPNAGHTFVDKNGNKMVNIALPNGIVSPKLKQILIGPGSIIEPRRMQEEMDNRPWPDADICIHEHAAVVQDRHREEEAISGLGIGSTMKGVGAAMCEKIRRSTNDRITAGMALRGTPLEGFVVPNAEYQERLDAADVVQIEGAQGYSLSINYGFYPYTTSRDCTAFQTLSDCGIPLRINKFANQPSFQVVGVARTYPIRVANRFKDGVQVGWSGPCYPDQHEISWSEIGLEPELTTVTRLPRRIFTFSEQQVHEAIRQNGVSHVFLNFCNYCGHNDDALPSIIQKIEKCAYVRWLGWGEREDMIIERLGTSAIMEKSYGPNAT